MTPCVTVKFEHKGGDKENERSLMFDASQFHENKFLSEIKQCF